MFKEAVEKYYPEMKAIREDIHRHPELSYKEERTSALIMEKLKEYGVDSVERTWMTGLVALIKGGKGEGKCIAIRADMDALPVTEETGVEFASENEGVMHACGHDMHITILLTAARILCENRDKFPGSVKLIFQPAEEAANPSDTTGGAMHMVEYGCMENPHVDAIIALHMNPATPDHNCQFAIKKGVITSGFDLYRFDVHGKTAHGSQPQNGNDAILALSQLIVLLQQIVSRNTDPLKTAILSVGTISGGLGEGSGHRGEVMRNVFVPDRGGGEGDLHRCVSSIRGGSAAIRSRPFGATMCKGLVAQVGGASEDARS